MTSKTSFGQIDQGLAANIALSATVANMVILVGNRQFDRFIALPQQDQKPRMTTLEGICHSSVAALATWVFDTANKQVSLYRVTQDVKLNGALPNKPGDQIPISVMELLQAFKNETVDPCGKLALVVDASLLMEDASPPREDDFILTSALEHFARSVDKSHLILLRTAKISTLPNIITSAPTLRVVNIPQAARDERYTYGCLRGVRLAAQCQCDLDSLARVIANVSDEWTLEQVESLIQTCEAQGVKTVIDVEETARAIRVGAARSAWAGDEIRKAVATAKGDLGQRVRGQPQAIDAVSTALRKATIGLSAAHQNNASQAPRGIFFFAGPTGTGKTELAKSISHQIYGQENLLRFDCGELRQDHAVARLIGAPPGYVGFDQGGELTEGIRAKPDSIVLFDEIEKAHPRLLDTLLGVLDDGRLTSGQGQTAYFNQAIIIFTSNLGMYEDVEVSGVITRRPRFNYDSPFEQIQAEVRKAIQHEFVSVLSRPELLGRIGGENAIIVFDYLRDLIGVTEKFVANIREKCLRLHGIHLTVADDVMEKIVTDTKASNDALVLGGRGLAHALDRILTNPLADYLFEANARNCNVSADLVGGQARFNFS